MLDLRSRLTKTKLNITIYYRLDKIKVNNKVWEAELNKTYDGTMGWEYCYSLNDAMIIEIADMETSFELNIRSSSEQPLESIEESDKDYFKVYDKNKVCEEFLKSKYSLEEVMTIGLTKARLVGWPIEDITYKVVKI